MNRFLSKLDLREIKIDPEGSRFPPDADETAPVESLPDEAPVAELEPRRDDAHVDGANAPIPFGESTWESPTFGAVQPHAALDPEPIIHSDASLAPAFDTVRHGRSEFGVEGVIVGSDGEVLKVSARSRPSAVAGAIAGVVREAGRAEVQAIGAGATNQAVKAVAIARDYLRETGIDAICVPAFIDVTIDNEDRTAIRLVVEPR